MTYCPASASPNPPTEAKNPPAYVTNIDDPLADQHLSYPSNVFWDTARGDTVVDEQTSPPSPPPPLPTGSCAQLCHSPSHSSPPSPRPLPVGVTPSPTQLRRLLPPSFSHPLATANTGRPPLDSSFPLTEALLASRSPNSSPYGAPKHPPGEDTLATMGFPTEDAQDTATSVIFSELAMAGTVGRAGWQSWDFRG